VYCDQRFTWFTWRGITRLDDQTGSASGVYWTVSMYKLVLVSNFAYTLESSKYKFTFTPHSLQMWVVTWNCWPTLHKLLNFSDCSTNWITLSEKKCSRRFVLLLYFLANVNSRWRSLYAVARPSVCRLSVCNACAPYSARWNFRQFFCGIWYLGHPVISVENFTQIHPGEPLRRGVYTQEG